MKASLFYRIAAVLLVLFAVSHLFGFSQVDPEWRADALVQSMKSLRFDAMGSTLSYWNFFLALGISVGVFYLFAALLVWRMASLSGEARVAMQIIGWGLAATFTAITVISYLYLFVIPLVMSGAITLCLVAGAALSRKPG